MSSFYWIRPGEHPCHAAEPRGNRLPRFVSYWWCPTHGRQCDTILLCESCPSFNPNEETIMAAPTNWETPAVDVNRDLPMDNEETLEEYVIRLHTEGVSIKEVSRRTSLGYDTVFQKLKKLGLAGQSAVGSAPEAPAAAPPVTPSAPPPEEPAPPPAVAPRLPVPETAAPASGGALSSFIAFFDLAAEWHAWQAAYLAGAGMGPA